MLVSLGDKFSPETSPPPQRPAAANCRDLSSSCCPISTMRSSICGRHKPPGGMSNDRLFDLVMAPIERQATLCYLLSAPSPSFFISPGPNRYCREREQSAITQSAMAKNPSVYGTDQASNGGIAAGSSSAHTYSEVGACLPACLLQRSSEQASEPQVSML